VLFLQCVKSLGTSHAAATKPLLCSIQFVCIRQQKNRNSCLPTMTSVLASAAATFVCPLTFLCKSLVDTVSADHSQPKCWWAPNQEPSPEGRGASGGPLDIRCELTVPSTAQRGWHRQCLSPELLCSFFTVTLREGQPSTTGFSGGKKA